MQSGECDGSLILSYFLPSARLQVVRRANSRNSTIKDKEICREMPKAASGLQMVGSDDDEDAAWRAPQSPVESQGEIEEEIDAYEGELDSSSPPSPPQEVEVIRISKYTVEHCTEREACMH